MNFHIYTCSASIILCASSFCSAQQIVSLDTAFLTKSVAYSNHLYFNAIQEQSRLYNGRDYIMYQSKEEEHPYFGEDDWYFGSILYDETFYDNVPIMYDISQDKVITEHMSNGSLMELVSKKIQRFTLGKHTFVRLSAEKNSGMSDGFYDLLYDGHTKVYARREKMLQESVQLNRIIARFDEKNKLFVFKDGIYFPVKSKGSVLQVLSDRKQNIKQFINKSRGINFKANREKALASIAEFYDNQKINYDASLPIDFYWNTLHCDITKIDGTGSSPDLWKF